MRSLVKLCVAAVALTIALAPAADAAPRKAPKGFVGVMWDREIQDAPRDVLDAQWGSMAESGVESARAIFSWDLAQPQAGKPPKFGLTDAMVEQAARHGIGLLPVITYAPPWARAVPHPASAPRNAAEYARYLRALVRRYGSEGRFWADNPKLPKRPIAAWQIWNEPPLDWQFRPHEGWAERYGKLLRASYREIKRSDPAAQVVAAGLANTAWKAIDRLYRRGGIRGHFDVAALHMYANNRADFLEIARRFRGALDRNGDRRTPIFVTEAGASASRGALDYPQQAHFQTTHKELAQLIPAVYKRLARMSASHRVARVYWYTWASPYTPESNVFGYSGLNAYRPGSIVWPMPALDGYSKVARGLQGCRKDTRARCR